MSLRDKEYKDCDHGLRDTRVPSNLGIYISPGWWIRELRVEEEF